MTPTPSSCEPTTPLRLAARLMADHDCAAIPVAASGELVGIITDRDIAERPASDFMSSPVIGSGGMLVGMLAQAEAGSEDFHSQHAGIPAW